MDENKRKHLEFIQNVITRMSTNSFLIKGWTVALVSALFALAAKDSDPRYVLVSYFAIPVFWLLDGFYLSQERQYRKLYDAARAAAATDFSMDASSFAVGRDAWLAAVFSTTLHLLYVPMIVIALIVMFVLQSHGK
ncbi:MAG TPA: hypothetical protein VHX86_06345 [Tepidisphaeraceae bacterium]|jgi:hypothetical protein|nr:hypothetical protein [Tepidisphaeraceae bacterium]